MMIWEKVRLAVVLANIVLAVGLVLFAMGLNPMDTSVPTLIFPKYEIGFARHLQSFFYGVLFFTITCTPFDFVGGWVLPRLGRLHQITLVSYLLGWVRMVLVHGAISLFGCIVLMYAGRVGGTPGGVAASTFLMILLLMLRQRLHRFSAGPLAKTPKNRDSERTPFRVALPAFLWNLIGISLASLHPEAGFYSAAGLTMTGLGFTLWNVSGLAVLRFIPLPDAEEIYRTAFYLNLACFGFLSRMLPENLGRPDLWIPLPRKPCAT